MNPAQAPPHEAGFVRRLLIALVRTVCRFPRFVLALSAVLCVLSLYAACFHLQYQTQRSDLISPRKECQQRWHDYVKEFGDDDDIVVVVKGSQRADMIAALEQVAERVRRQPAQFDRLFYKADLRALHDRALLMLPLDEIKTIRHNLDDMKELLAASSADPKSLFYPWRRLTLSSLLIRAGDSLPEGQPLSAEDVQFFTQLLAVTRAAGSYLDDPKQYSNPWGSLMASHPAGQQDLLAEPQYFFSGDGRPGLPAGPAGQGEGLVHRRPQERRGDARPSSPTPAPTYPGLEFGLTGLPVLETDEMAAAQHDTRTGVVAGHRRRDLAVPAGLPRRRTIRC